jgi:cyclophilin family peptidyl-prolyl cis-trans isomerase
MGNSLADNQSTMIPNICRQFISVLAVLLFTLGCSSAPPRESESQPVAETVAEPLPPSGTPHAVITTDKGTIVIELREDLAPKAVDNFIKLANQGFYYGTTFHRVLPDQLIQGGDPNSRDTNPYNDGQGNSGRFLPAEFSAERFTRGTVAMARQENDPNSASCQFFICLKRTAAWDGQYTVFGKVVEGIDVVEKISRSPVSKDPRLRNMPTGKQVMQSVAIEYREP